MKKSVTLLVLFFAFASVAGEVFFVPGWRTGYSSRAGCVRIIRDIWPGMTVTVKSWNSMVGLGEARVNAELYCKTLLAEIIAMPESSRKQLILTGHSLGAAIVLEILAELDKRNLQIRSAALLGAPVANDDSRILRALNAVTENCYNVAFAGDGVLRLLCPLSGTGNALGIDGWCYRHPRFIESRVEQSFSFYHHYAYRYLEALDKLMDSLIAAPVPEIAGGCQPYFYDETGFFWNTVSEYAGWQLQKHLYNGEFRLLDPRKRIRMTGDGTTLHGVWEQVKSQLAAGKK